MVGLLVTAFPTAAQIIRRTADADAAVSTQVAASGALHLAFTRAGYEPRSGNRYERDDEPERPGTRGDAQLVLHEHAGTAHRSPIVNRSGVRPEVLVALIRAKVGEPRKRPARPT